MDISSLSWKPLLPVILLAFLFLYEEWVSVPSCTFVPHQNDAVRGENGEDGLRVMMVANLLLLGSEASSFDLYFRDYYMSKFFQKAFHSLKPDMLVVLGDVSAKGFELTKTTWVSVLHQFHAILGPFLELPFHAVLGDRDVGECSTLDSRTVNWISRSFPGLDSSGCGGFEISNVSFVSLNAVGLLCGNNKVRFSVERRIETESVDLRMEMEGSLEEMADDNEDFGELPARLMWRENAVLSGSGPVVLLHFPLHRVANESCTDTKSFEKTTSSFRSSTNALGKRKFSSGGPYDLSHIVPPNATEYIFQALKPRIIFSAHSHEFCDHIHSDGTREVTVPAMTWKARDDPGFVIASFPGDKRAVSVSYCAIVRESHVLIVYTCFLVLLLTVWLVTNKPQHRCLR